MDTVKSRGFSILEMLVAMFIFTLMTAGVLTLVSATQRSYTNEQSNNDAAWQGRAAVDLMMGELRMAGYPPKNTYAATAGLTSANSSLVAATFLTATATQVVFEADLDGNGVVERVEYRLSGTTFQRSAVSKNANGTAPAAQYDTLAGNVTNGSTPIFTYTTDPLSTQASPGNVNSAQIRLQLRTAKPDPKNGQYATFLFRGGVYRQNPER